MARKRYTAEQIVAILREAERDANTQETCRRHGISEQTFYRWRKMYGDLGASQVQQMKALEEENRKLKQLVGDQALALQVMKDHMKKKGWA